MLDYIAKTKEARTTQMDYPCLFDNTNIESVFGMLDPTKKGFISLEQYTQGMTSCFSIFALSFNTFIIIFISEQWTFPLLSVVH